MKTITTIEDQSILAEIRSRRGYHAVCILIEQVRDSKTGHVRYTSPAHFPDLGRLCRLLREHFCGLSIDQETLAVALADSGFIVEMRKAGLYTDFTDEYLLHRCAQDRWKPGTSKRLAKYSDPIAEQPSSTLH